MKRLSNALVALVLLGLAACKQNPTPESAPPAAEQLRFEIQKDSNANASESALMCRLSYPVALGNSPAATAINDSLFSYVVGMIAEYDTVQPKYKNRKELIAQIEKDFKAYREDFPEALPMWGLEANGTVVSQRPNFLCIGMDYYLFRGGAHPVSYMIYHNFDPVSGKPIPNTELFSDTESVRKLVESRVFTSLPSLDGSNQPDRAILFDSSRVELAASIGFTDTTMIAYYNVYDIMPYVAGPTVIEIPLDSVRKFLKIKL